MSRIATGSAEGAEQGYRPYLRATLLMGLFTFLFLCAEYLYVDVLSRMVCGDRAVLAQNEALGVSTVGFLLYPLAERSCREWLRRLLLGLAGLLPVGCIPLVCGGTAYRVTFPVGLLIKSRRACSGETEQRQESSGKERTVGLLLALMTCVFSTLDNAVTLVHSSGETDIGQWPRALLAGAMGTAEVTLHKQRKEQRQ